MLKVKIAGSKKHLEKTIDKLYSLKKIDIRKPENGIETGSPLEKGDEISETLVKIRSIKSSLPEPENPAPSKGFETLQSNLDRLQEEIEESSKKIEEKSKEIEKLDGKADFLENFTDTDLKTSDLEGTKNLRCVVGEFPDNISLDPETDRFEIIEGKNLDAVFYLDEDVGKTFAKEGELVDKPEFKREGTLEQVYEQIRAEINQKQHDIEVLEKKLSTIAENWSETLDQGVKFLEEEIEKSEAPLSFATTKSAFIAEGYVPKEDYDFFRREMERSLEGSIHIESEDDFDEEPPVKHENPSPIDNFEPLNDLISVPRYNEIDPSILLLLTFPAMFGFMIGDAGYGLTTAAVFLGAMKVFPSQKKIFRSLLFASLFTFLFGLAFGDAFGYVIFGSHSMLTKVTGLEIFSQIPILFHRAEHLTAVFEISVLIGLAHVNLGFIVGMYNEYLRHGLKEAALAKGSWIGLEISALIGYLFSPAAGAAAALVSISALYSAEGVEGIVEIPSLASNILSYARLFGVSVAAVVLAKVVNTLAAPLLGAGIISTAAGILLLALGHTFNTFIKIMEGFLQGIRLHYVEFYSKFYDGGGSKFVPFGK